jgi:hypothetical protein
MTSIESIKFNELHEPIQKWAVAHEPKKEMYYYNGYWDQIMVVRDVLPSILFNDLDFEEAEKQISVISHHTSKSIHLPVYLVEIPSHGISLIMRNNFYDWKISVQSPEEIDVNFLNLFKEDEKISDLHCEGFHSEWVFPSYKENKKEFTIEIGDHYRLHTFLWILNDYLKKNK